LFLFPNVDILFLFVHLIMSETRKKQRKCLNHEHQSVFYNAYKGYGLFGSPRIWETLEYN